MITIVAHMTVPDRAAAAEIEAAAVPFNKTTLAEPGCVDHRLHRATDDPTRYVWYETFADQSAVDDHVASAHVVEWFALLDRLGATNEYALYERISP